MEAAGKRYIVHPSRSDTFRIWSLSDLHLLSAACDEAHLKRDINEIRDDPLSFWIGGGDYADYIGYKDKRFEPKTMAPWVKVCDMGEIGRVGTEKVRDLFEPIKHKCLGLVLGNHEDSYQRFTDHTDQHAWLCHELGVPNLEYSALLDVIFVRQPRSKPRLQTVPPARGGSHQRFRLYIHHGAGGAVTPGGKLNTLIRFMKQFEADIYFIGHVHDKVARLEPMLGANEACDRLVAHERVGLISGSYLKTYAEHITTYGEKRAYPPTSLGATRVEIHPETRAVTAMLQGRV